MDLIQPIVSAGGEGRFVSKTGQWRGGVLQASTPAEADALDKSGKRPYAHERAGSKPGRNPTHERHVYQVAGSR